MLSSQLISYTYGDDLHDRVSQEVDPDPVPPNTVFGNNDILVGYPV